jgi:hypothetical protein
MVRNKDESGISGTGVVLEGAIFSNGMVVTYWLGRDYNSFGIHEHFYAFNFIHIKSHPTNDTELIFDGEEKPVRKESRKNCRHCKQPYEEHPKDKQGEANGFRRSCSGNLIELVHEDN